jgi:hypothetical protein
MEGTCDVATCNNDKIDTSLIKDVHFILVSGALIGARLSRSVQQKRVDDFSGEVMVGSFDL